MEMRLLTTHIYLILGLNLIDTDVKASHGWSTMAGFLDLDELLRQSEGRFETGLFAPSSISSIERYSGGRSKRSAGQSKGSARPLMTANKTIGDSGGYQRDQCKARGSGKGRSQKQFKATIVEKKEHLILRAIQAGDDRPNDYISLSTVSCLDDDQCLEACALEGCNYFLSPQDRSHSNLTFQYIVNEEILSKRENFIKSSVFTSYITKYEIDRKVAKAAKQRKESLKARPRPERQAPTNCAPCYNPQPPAPPLFVCRVLCNGSLAGTIVALSVGLGVGLGTQAAALGPASAAVRAAAMEHTPEAHQFNSFKDTYPKSYQNSQELQQARETFHQNQQNMQNSNKQNQRYDDARQGTTKFADMTFGNFSRYYLGAFTNGSVQPEPFQPPLSEIVPTPLLRLHWDNAGSALMPPVRYQGQCGSCYAFTTADLVAAQNRIERNRVLKDTTTQELSVQYMIDCGGENASVGCKGGRPALLLKNLENTDGVPYESCYPYRQQAGTCQKRKAEKCCHRQKVKFSQLLDVRGPREKQIMANLLNWGPLIVIVGVNEQWMFYNGSGIIKSRQCTPNVHNHAVMIVGYNYNPATEATPYYVIRNSWGVDWGTNGHAKLEAGRNACGVAKYVLITCTGDCRNVTSAHDLINRSNVPEKVLKNSSRKAGKSAKQSR